MVRRIFSELRASHDAGASGKRRKFADPRSLDGNRSFDRPVLNPEAVLLAWS